MLVLLTLKVNTSASICLTVLPYPMTVVHSIISHMKNQLANSINHNMHTSQVRNQESSGHLWPHIWLIPSSAISAQTAEKLPHTRLTSYDLQKTKSPKSKKDPQLHI